MNDQSQAPGRGVSVRRLTCEYLVDPIGIDTPQPRLSWMLETIERGQGQTACRILVASSRQTLDTDVGDLWDSGEMAGDRSVHVPYDGRPLASRQRCFWKVRVWDRHGQPSDWSNVATFETGLLAPDDWQGTWIGPADGAADRVEPAPLLRRDFVVAGPVRAARAYVCGVGYYELRLNGEKVGDHVLDPGFTRYDRRVLYVTHDVTGHLCPGPNAVGVILGNGSIVNHIVPSSLRCPVTPPRAGRGGGDGPEATRCFRGPPVATSSSRGSGR